MASHDYHDALPGFHPDQIWHDGCGECEWRAHLPLDQSIPHLDSTRFARAWDRAWAWQSGRMDRSTLSDAELPLLRALYVIRLRVESMLLDPVIGTEYEPQAGWAALSRRVSTGVPGRHVALLRAPDGELYIASPLDREAERAE